MKNERASHTMIQHNEFFLAIAGVNTNTNEIYDTKTNQWKKLPDLQSTAPNPALAIINNVFIFFFW